MLITQILKNGTKIIFFVTFGSPAQIWTGDPYIISVVL